MADTKNYGFTWDPNANNGDGAFVLQNRSFANTSINSAFANGSSTGGTSSRNYLSNDAVNGYISNLNSVYNIGRAFSSDATAADKLMAANDVINLYGRYGSKLGENLGKYSQYAGKIGAVGSTIGAAYGIYNNFENGDIVDKTLGNASIGLNAVNSIKNGFSAQGATTALGKTAAGVGAAYGLYSMGRTAVNSAKTGKVDPIGGAIEGASTGAAIGSFFPGYGTLIGAGIGTVVGAAAGSIGTPGYVDNMTGKITNSNGLNNIFDFGHSKGYLKNWQRNVYTGIQLNALGLKLYNDYYAKYGNKANTVPGLAEGGIVPDALAYLDDGELIRTPDGLISQVPEQGKPTDSNLVKVPVGTQVLSDKIKVPGTKKTFAQAGKEIMKKKKYGSDVYAENSKKLNEQNQQQAYDELLQLQESIKDKGSKTKNGIKAYDGGTEGVKYSKEYLDMYNKVRQLGRDWDAENKEYGYGDYYFSKQKEAEVLLKKLESLNKLTSLFGDVSNFAGAFREKLTPEQVQAYTYTPTFGPTYYNVNPVLQQTDTSDRIARYNMRNINHNTGANMAYGIQSAIARNKAYAEAYAQKNNVESSLAFQNANIANTVNQYNTTARHTAADEYAKNKGAADTANTQNRAALYKAIAQYGADQKRTKYDQATLAYMLPLLQYGSQQADLNALAKAYLNK